MTEDRTLPSGTPPSPESGAGAGNPFSLPPPDTAARPAPPPRSGPPPSRPAASGAPSGESSSRGDVPSWGSAGPFAPPRRVGWAYLLAACLGAAMLVGFANPWTGTVVLEWPWSVLAHFAWTPHSAKVAFAILACLAPVLGLLLPASRGRGAVAGLLSMLALAALAVQTERVQEVEVPVALYTVETYVPPLLAAAVVGALLAGARARRPGTGRGVAGACGFMLAAVLLYPLAPGPESSPTLRGEDYHSILFAAVNEVVSSDGPGAALEFLAHPWAATLWLSAAIAVLGLLGGALGATRAKAYSAVVLLLLLVAYPLAYWPIEAGVRKEGGEAAWLSFAGSLAGLYGPWVLTTFAVTTDLLRGRPGTE